MSTPRYLILSDDPAVCDFVTRKLQADGAAVERATGLEEAYEKLSAGPYRAVLLDLTPRLVGHLLLLASRTIENERTPFVVLLGPASCTATGRRSSGPTASWSSSTPTCPGW